MSRTDTQPRADADMIRAMIAAGDRSDTDGLLTCLSDDDVLVFGNSDPVVGKEAILTQWREFLSTLKGIRHEIHDLWHAAEDPDVVIARMTVHYSKLDGSIVTVPCVNVFGMQGDLVADYRIYIDVSPVLAESDTPSSGASELSRFGDRDPHFGFHGIGPGAGHPRSCTRTNAEQEP
jgi:ketosteroid isomerase-like protein